MSARDIALRFLAHVRATACAPGVLFIDGHSGSGKTTLAGELATELAAKKVRGSAPQILGMDELYPGWDGLAAGSVSLARVLETAQYRRYDWHASAFLETVMLSPQRTLIVEGCGSISGPAIAAAIEVWGAAYTVWIESPGAVRRTRALTRDGEIFAPHWDDWAKAERELFATTQPRSRAREFVHVG